MHDYIISLVNLYGVVHKEKVVEIYNEQNDDAIDLSVIEKVVKNDERKLEENFSFVEGDYFVQEALYIFDEINESLAGRVGKPFYIPAKRELLKYKDEFYFEKTKQFNALLRYVQKNFTNGNRSKAFEISEDVLLMCQNEARPTVIFDQLSNLGVTFENEKQIGEVLDLIMELANNSRLWVNNGFTPNELSRIANPTLNKAGSVKRDQTQSAANMTKQKKVGRNELCPCGCGKKFKKCCMA